MSTTAKLVVIVSSILLVCLIGVGIIVGIYYSNDNKIDGISNLFGKGVAVNESETLNLEGVDTLVINTTSAQIDVVESDTSKVTLIGTIWSTEETSEFLDVSNAGGSLIVKVEPKTKPFGIYNSEVTLTVYVPKENDFDLQIRSSSGDVTLSELAFGEVSVNCSSGDTEIISCSGSTLSVEKSSGDTYVENDIFNNMILKSTSGRTRAINCEGTDLRIEKSSGDTYGENLSFETLYIDSTSGNTEVKNTSADITHKSSSGDTTFTGVKGSVDIRSTSGKVSVSVNGTKPEAISIYSSSGRVELYLDNGANFNLSAKASSGDINTDFEITVQGTTNDLSQSIEGKSGNGGSDITIETTSGNIDIIKK